MIPILRREDERVRDRYGVQFECAMLEESRLLVRNADS